MNITLFDCILFVIKLMIIGLDVEGTRRLTHNDKDSSVSIAHCKINNYSLYSFKWCML